MISFKVSVAMNHTLELRAKIKIDTETNENCLPFEDLIIEAMPSNEETPEIRLKIINTTKNPNSNIEPKFPSDNSITKKPWWQWWF